jgi:hypothetical protein
MVLSEERERDDQLLCDDEVDRTGVWGNGGPPKTREVRFGIVGDFTLLKLKLSLMMVNLKYL